MLEEGWDATAIGEVPVAMGVPGAVVSDPVELIKRMLRLSAVRLVT